MIWTPEALRDVQRCHRFLVAKNPAAAMRAVQAIREGVRILVAHPGAGRPVDRLDPQFREWPIGFGDSGYVALYRLEGGRPEEGRDGNRAVILAVRHQREAGYG